MDSNDFMVVLGVVLLLAFLLIYRRGICVASDNLVAAAVGAQKRIMQGGAGAANVAVAATTQAEKEIAAEGFRSRFSYERAADAANYHTGPNSATIGDATLHPEDLFPEKRATQHMDSDWNEMFSHAENTLAQENFIEPSFEYSLGSINTPKRWLTQDLRGAPEVQQYDHLSIWNNSGFAALDLSETATRRAGDL